MSVRDPKARFSSRVENYVKYRPTYPSSAIDLLKRDCGLQEGAVVADIGSGTGILTSLLLDAGATVYGVEPNEEMRDAAEQLLSRNPRFHSVNTAAEDTGLESGTVDLITAGQAFHWFDWDAAKAEFRRILKPEGWAVLIWNDRSSENNEFGRRYEALLHTHSPEYKEVRHRNIDGAKLTTFFRNSEMRVAFRPNIQAMNYEELEGRLLSSSYSPQAGEPGYDEMLVRLKEIFEDTAENGKVSFVYETQIYYGRV